MTCRNRRPYLGPADPIRAARLVLIVCTKEAAHQSPHYDASCDVSWPNDRDAVSPVTDNPELDSLARMAHHQFLAVITGRIHQGAAYGDLDELIKVAWRTAVGAVVRATTVPPADPERYYPPRSVQEAPGDADPDRDTRPGCGAAVGPPQGAERTRQTTDQTEETR